ncbi:hypothetical protein, conserved [Plasmodium gonderi]|uniref:Uncharacterized protein n=1 Tax=Plasmodium gonderi TaxID=77519 RepID=A0A1Y1JD93_PLAGO|nr:hypothetical protein, conserved [Plasmodium gonderi]GAW80501.1 hypothetical protein, conserved [Plasmodium gonderi]
MMHWRLAARNGGAIKCVSIIRNKGNPHKLGLKKFPWISKRKLNSGKTPEAESSKGNNISSIICENKKNKKKIFKSLLGVTFLFYICYESLHAIQNNEQARKKIKLYPLLYDIIEVKIMPLKIHFDVMVGKLKGFLLVLLRNGQRYSLQLCNSLKEFFSKNNENFNIFIGAIKKLDISAPFSFFFEWKKDAQGEDNLNVFQKSNKLENKIDSFIKCNEVHMADDAHEEDTYSEDVSTWKKIEETGKLNPIREDYPNNIHDEHSTNDDIKDVINLFNSVNTLAGNEMISVLEFHPEDQLNGCPIDRNNNVFSTEISNGEITEQIMDEKGASENITLPCEDVEKIEKKKIIDESNLKEDIHEISDNTGKCNHTNKTFISVIECDEELTPDEEIINMKEPFDEMDKEKDRVYTYEQQVQVKSSKKEEETREKWTEMDDRTKCGITSEEKLGIIYDVDAKIIPEKFFHMVEEKDLAEENERAQNKNVIMEYGELEKSSKKKNSTLTVEENVPEDLNRRKNAQIDPKNFKNVRAVITDGNFEIPLDDILLKRIVENEVKNFETQLKNLTKEELKNKIVNMFINELLTKKYKDILMEEEKETLKKLLTIKYNDIYWRRKKKMEKSLQKFMEKKLKQEQILLKRNYENEKENFESLMINQKKEEVKMEKIKIEEELNMIRENYLNKINMYACDVNVMKDYYFKENVKKIKLETIIDIQNQLVHLQNCIIQDLSIESILTDLKKKFKKDTFLDTVFTTLPDNFFSHTFKPTPNNIDKIKKEFYALYKEGVKEAFVQHSENYFFKSLISVVISFFYLNYEAKLNRILQRTLKENSVLKSNLLNLSYALSSVQQNQFIDALQYIDDLTGSCKNTFSPFNEHVKNVIMFKYYLRLAVSRLMLASKLLITTN